MHTTKDVQSVSRFRERKILSYIQESIVVEPKPIVTPALQLTTPHTVEQKFTRTHRLSHSQIYRDTHEILVIMDCSFFSFSVRLQFVRSHTDYVYFFFRFTVSPVLNASCLLFLSSLNKIDCYASSSSSSSLFCYGFG